MSNYIRIYHATFGEGDRDTVWEANADLLDHPGGGTDEGRILVRLDVDGQMDIVYGDLSQGGDLAGLDRAITAMQKARDGLAELYGGRNAPGRCWEQGGWGRCYHELGHAGDHKFPTEASARTLLSVGTREVMPSQAAS